MTFLQATGCVSANIRKIQSGDVAKEDVDACVLQVVDFFCEWQCLALGKWKHLCSAGGNLLHLLACCASTEVDLLGAPVIVLFSDVVVKSRVRTCNMRHAT